MKPYSPEMIDFVESARGFCKWCESSDSEFSDSQAAYWLARLYAQAILLPETEPENEAGMPVIAAEILDRAKANLATFSGRYYREIFDPSPEGQDEPVMGDLGDDLLDTYRDIRGGLQLFDLGDQSEALWHWSFLHRIHWGHHAAGALYALHVMSVSKSD